MTVLEAAYIVLKEAGKPLHQNEIAERIRRRRLHPLQGKTPGRTVGSVISTDIKNNDASRFVKTAPATFGLCGPRKIRKAVLKAAYTILREVGAPLHQDETAECIRHLWPGLMRGKTPGVTDGSAIYMDIKKQRQRASRFGKEAPFTF